MQPNTFSVAASVYLELPPFTRYVRRHAIVNGSGNCDVAGIRNVRVELQRTIYVATEPGAFWDVCQVFKKNAGNNDTQIYKIYHTK